MLRTALRAASAGHPNDQGYLWLAAKHVVKFGRAIDYQVAGEQTEIDGHQFEDGAQTAQRRADGRTGYYFFRQGSVAHALFAKLLEQSFADGVGAAITGDIFTQDKNAFVA